MAWTKVYTHGNNTRFERRYTNMAITHNLNEGIQTCVFYCHVCKPVFKPCVIAMSVFLRSSCVLLPCLYTFVQAVCYCHICIPSFKPCVIAMFVYLRSSRALLQCLYTFVQAVRHCHVCIPSFKPCGIAITNMAITHNLNEGIQTWQCRTAWTKVYKHGNNTRLGRRYTNMAITHGLNEGIQIWQ
jgi:hypothetical protein